jgi:hypothetical protein
MRVVYWMEVLSRSEQVLSKLAATCLCIAAFCFLIARFQANVGDVPAAFEGSTLSADGRSLASETGRRQDTEERLPSLIP